MQIIIRVCDSECSVYMFASSSDIVYTVSFFLIFFSLYTLQNLICNHLYSDAKDNSLL